jgi:hypothetical protein
VPLARAELMGDRLRVPHEKTLCKNAPHVVASGGRLSPDEAAQLHSHYGLDAAVDHDRSGGAS